VKLQVEVAEAALDEADEAHAWYFERDPDVAARFSEEVDRIIGILGRFPETWAERKTGYRHAVLTGFPYIMVYRVLPDRVRVLAVAHAKRRPGYRTAH
jgi:toxin ParE1/3/4